MRITVIGCGYLGTTHAACMAELGFEVLGVEFVQSKLEQLQAGDMPFYEPGLEELLKRHVESGRLRFTSSMKEAACFADLHFLCVGTPQQRDGIGADLTYVDGAIESLAPHLTRPALVVGKSTVPVGTARRLAERLRSIAPAGNGVELAWNPEFLREGFAVQDTIQPDRLVFGVESQGAEERLRQVYAQPISEDVPVIVTDFPTAELVKVSANAFLATKISFINAMAEMCEVSGANVVQLADALGHDVRIGRRSLNAGIGFGGGCLPKDIRAFQARASELGVRDVTNLLQEVDAINQRRREQVVAMVHEAVGGAAGAKIAVLGAAFKPNSDDIRDSPALWVSSNLQRDGASVTIYDPRAMANARDRYPQLAYADTPHQACRDADLVLHVTEWHEFREIDPRDLGKVVTHRRLLDARNCLDVARWRDAGWDVRSLGRP